MGDLDTDRTPEAVCPSCGYKHRDSWEFSDGEHECHDCGEPFSVTVNHSVTYTTRRVAEKTA